MDISEKIKNLDGLKRVKQRREKMPEDACCYICGADRSTIRLRKYNEYILCEKHFNQMDKFQKITDPTSREHKIPQERRMCCICGALKMASFEGKDYCRKHYIQMTRHGKINSTIYDKNEWIDCGDYYECVLKDKNAVEVGRTKIDKEDYDKLKDYKIYRRCNDKKNYAYFSIRGTSKKVTVHRFLMGLADTKYSIDQVIDHINGDSLDNRKSNLRICTQHENSKNGRKKNKTVGVRYIKSYNGTNKGKWNAQITSNYKTIFLGYYDTKEEAILARLKKEKEICQEYGPNRDLYYLLDHPSPIEELKNILSEGV